MKATELRSHATHVCHGCCIFLQSNAFCLKLQTHCKDNDTALVRGASMMAALRGVCMCDVQGL